MQKYTILLRLICQLTSAYAIFRIFSNKHPILTLNTHSPPVQIPDFSAKRANNPQILYTQTRPNNLAYFYPLFLHKKMLFHKKTIFVVKIKQRNQHYFSDIKKITRIVFQNTVLQNTKTRKTQTTQPRFGSLLDNTPCILSPNHHHPASGRIASLD